MIIDSGVITGSLQVSGSFSVTGSSNLQGPVTISGSLNVNGPISGAITGSVTSASYATFAENAGTASYVANAVSASRATSAANADNATLFNSLSSSQFPQLVQNNTFTGNNVFGNITGSNAKFNTASIEYLNVIYQTSSIVYSSGSNQFGDASVDVQTLYGKVDIKTGPVLVTGSLNVSGGITGSLVGTASYAINAGTAATASFVTTAQTASYVASAVSASRATSAANADTASYVANAVSASRATSAANADTASYVANAVSASFATTASTLAGGIPQSFPYTGSAIISGSLGVTGSINASQGITGSLFGTASFALSASYAPGGGGAAFPFTGSATITGSLTVVGTTTTTTLVETSALRYKENIQDLDSADSIYKLRPVTFDWKVNHKQDIGFIAEEVNEILPVLAEMNEDGQAEGVKYSKLTAILTKALQVHDQRLKDQQKQIEELQQEINNLKNK